MNKPEPYNIPRGEHKDPGQRPGYVSRDDIEYDVAEPQILPRPTFWPFVMAVGLAFLLWWVVASWIVGAIGFCLFVAGLSGWIHELRNEENQET